HPLTGTRAPDLTLGDTGLFALLRVDRHLLLDLTGSSRLTGYARRGLHIHAATPYQPPAEFTGIRAVLVRPDGHIAWASAERDDTALTEGLTAVLATTHRR
ncbi:aromatic-ring hydroxylase C-terminal domain-containing protein, partial [Streptomyces sp. AC154]|uniref:aromatic-ring hydroxylase C-terminal domain-containing protein n=1 Tax=Streptomyces sp. AC154 TaxID=3143184 RepID=UPI003F7FCD43